MSGWDQERYDDMRRQGVRFYEAHPDLCNDSPPPGLPMPVMPERESEWLSAAGPDLKKKVEMELGLTNEFLARYGFPRLFGAFALDEEGRPNVVIRPLALPGQSAPAPSFRMPVEDFSSHGAHLFVMGMNAARRLSLGPFSEAERAKLERFVQS